MVRVSRVIYKGTHFLVSEPTPRYRPAFVVRCRPCLPCLCKTANVEFSSAFFINPTQKGRPSFANTANGKSAWPELSLKCTPAARRRCPFIVNGSASQCGGLGILRDLQ